MTGSEDSPAAPTEDAAPDDAQARNAEASDEAPGRRPGERLAKAIARAGLGSRREAEGWIEHGRVAVNGETVRTPNLNVGPGDRVEVDGRPLPERERTRLWLYHKPRGYVTTTHDPEGRETVFSILPESLPRVMTVGRLDINTEGLLLLTNDGGLARVLELPETGWLRRYRVRAFGKTDPGALEALGQGVEIDGFAYGAIDAEIERQQKDNVWLRFGLREGKNREVKRVAEHLGLSVNRLIRISFGPFQLGDLPEGGVEEVRTRTLIEQLGKRLTEEAGCDFEAPAISGGEDAPRKTGGRGGARKDAATPERSRMLDASQRVGRRAPIARPREMAAPVSKSEAEAPETRVKRAAPIADRRGRQVKVERVARTDPEAAPKRFRKKDEGAAERFGAAGRPPRPERPGRGDKPGGPKGFGKGPRAERDSAPRDRRSDGDRPRGKPFGEDRHPAKPFGEDRRAGFERPRAEAAVDAPKPQTRGPRVSEPRWRQESGEGERGRPARPPRGDRPGQRSDADRPRGARPGGDRPGGGRPWSDRPKRDGDQGERPRSDRPRGDRPAGDRPRGERAAGDRPARGGEGRPPRGDGPRPARNFGDRPQGDRPRGERPSGDRPPHGDRPRGERSFGDRPPRSEGAPGGAGKPRPAGGKTGGRPGGKPFGKPAGKPFGKPAGKPGGGPRGPRPGGGGGAPRGGGRGGGQGGGQGGGRGRPGGADRRR